MGGETDSSFNVRSDYVEWCQGEKVQFVECGHHQREQWKMRLEESVGPRLWSILIKPQSKEFSFILVH